MGHDLWPSGDDAREWVDVCLRAAGWNDCCSMGFDEKIEEERGQCRGVEAPGDDARDAACEALLEMFGEVVGRANAPGGPAMERGEENRPVLARPTCSML